MRKKPALVWDSWNIEHIKKHKVAPEEVTEGYQEAFLQLKRPDKKILLLNTKIDHMLFPPET